MKMEDILEPHVNCMSGNVLDRAAHLRDNPKWLKSAIESSESKFIVFKDLNPLCVKEEKDDGDEIKKGKTSLTYFNYEQLSVLIRKSFSERKGAFTTASDFGSDENDKVWPRNILFLGTGTTQQLKDLNPDSVQTPWFAVDITRLCSRDTEQFEEQYLPGNEFLNSRKAAFTLSSEEASIFSQARSMLAWLDRYQFCATCGERMSVQEAGYKAVCDENCRSSKGRYSK